MIADNLRKIYTNFDPLMPLSGDSELYVERRNNPLGEMEWDLMNDNPIPPKFLFSGHRGSGKSTELNKLMANVEIKGKYFIVHYSVREVLDVASLDYTDLLLSIGAQIFIKADDEKLKLRKKLLDELDRWKGTIEKEILSEESATVQTEVGLKAFFVKAMAGLKVGYKSREKMRQTIEPQLSELINIIDSLVAEVELASGKRVLVAIDDLDKPDRPVTKELFYERRSSLTLPNCSIIYTIPIALLYSPEAGQVKQAFTDSYVLPNVTITTRDDRNKQNEEGRTQMKEFVLKRMSPDLIEKDALEHAITISGGVFREMARIMRRSASKAFARGEERIELVDVKKAESDFRNEFRRMLQVEDYKELKEVFETRKLEVSDQRAKLLHNLSVLEYQNENNWCDVHPIAASLLEE